MPVQIWTPTARNSDNSALAAAIAGAGRSLGDALGRIADEHKRKNTQSKAVESFISAMTDEERQSAGVPDLSQFKNLSADDKIAFGTGLAMRRQVRRDDQANQLNLEQLATLQLNRRRKEAELANFERSPAFYSALRRYASPAMEALPPGIVGPPNQVPGLDMDTAALAAAEETGYTPDDSILGRLLQRDPSSTSIFRREELGKVQPTGVDEVDFVPTTKSGGQLLDRRAPAPKPGDEGSIEIPDATDPVYGPRIRIPISVARRQYPHLLKGLEAGAKPGAEPAAGGAPLPLPKSATELKVGQTYQTARGIAQWDGKKFQVVK